jgi:ABC-type Mn2+/Zn2+ transport system ATPase subunit
VRRHAERDYALKNLTPRVPHHKVTAIVGASGSGKTTSYRKTLPFVPNMEGQADIVTDDISLLERLPLPIRKVLTEGM